uniref:Uncharacterized protein n=1 Tax=Rhizophagus irregularis (strain DAOM 181602 / DAOM 197198 / MUCL 43194) TaxID=747089 RepID=U9UVR8_RHIID
MIQAKARPLAKRPVYETLYPSIKEGKFSRKWVDDFISRHNLVDRRKITVAQWQQNDFLSCAFSNTTVEQRGTRTISTLSTGYEYANFTVVLACKADGIKLLPYWILLLHIKTNTVIPGGLTSRLQPLDVSLNKLFKDKMSEEIKEYKSTEKIKKPSYSLVANWVKESWDAVDINIIY